MKSLTIGVVLGALLFASASTCDTNAPTTGHALDEVNLISRINDVRADAGCARIGTDGRLANAAYRHAKDMIAHPELKFVQGHPGFDGSSPQSRITDAGYVSTATKSGPEVLYSKWGSDLPGQTADLGYSNRWAQEAVNWWNDPQHADHYATLHNCEFTHIGAAAVYKPDGTDVVFVVDFGKSP